MSTCRPPRVANSRGGTVSLPRLRTALRGVSQRRGERARGPRVARSRASPHPRGRPRGSPGSPLCPPRPRPRPAPPVSSLDSESSGFRLLCAVCIERHGEDFEHRRKKKKNGLSPWVYETICFAMTSTFACARAGWSLRKQALRKATASKTSDTHANRQERAAVRRPPGPRPVSSARPCTPTSAGPRGPPHVAHVLTPPGKPPGRAPAAPWGRRGPGGRTGRGPAED